MPDLQPVEYDPFNPTVLPVEHDPFSVGPIPKAGKTIQPVNALAAASPVPAGGYLSGLAEAAKVPSMTEGEQQMFFLGALPALIGGPEAKVAEEAAPAVAKGIRAFHGSPHDFNAFDMSKIGTGEGAQAYGHGLYFAENPAAADVYRQQLAGQNTPSSARFYLQRAGNDPQKALAQWDKDQAAFVQNNPSHYERYPDDLTENNAIRDEIAKGRPGKTYEVNINADPEHFLDWDKPLSEQSPKVQEALAQHGFTADETPQSFYGEQLYRRLSDASEPLESAKSSGERTAAEKLRDAGIPGIKYLDQGSRNAGGWHITPPSQTMSGKWMVKSSDYNSQGMHFDTEGEAQQALQDKTGGQTRNYVVFNDKLIDIVKKYGMAGLVAGGAAHYSTQPVDHDPFH